MATAYGCQHRWEWVSAETSIGVEWYQVCRVCGARRSVK